MRKILLFTALMLISLATMAQSKLEFTFNRSANTVSATMDGIACPDITASIAISPDKYLTSSNCANDSILAINRNTTSASEADPNTYTLTISGLEEGTTFNGIIVGGVAVNSGGAFQGMDTNRDRNFKIGYGEDADNLTYTDAVTKRICDNNHCNGKPTDHSFTTEGHTDSGNLTVQVQVYTDGGLGCFYGLTSITLVVVPSHTLTVSNAEWSTLILDFNAAIPVAEGFNAYTISAVENGYVTLEEATGVLGANTPVIINAPAGEYKFTYSSENSTVNPTTQVLKGTLANTTITKEEGYSYYILGIKNDVVGFYNPVLGDNDTQFINYANRAYLAVPEEQAQGAVSYGFRFGEGTTGINEVKTENGEIKGIFDLTGRRVENTEIPGIYIINGKKVLVK